MYQYYTETTLMYNFIHLRLSFSPGNLFKFPLEF